MEPRNTAELERLALNLYKLESQLNHAVKTRSPDMRLILACLDIQERIRENLADSQILNIPNPTARDLVQKVRDEKNLTSTVLSELEPVLIRLFKERLGNEALEKLKTSLPEEYEEWTQELLGYIDLETFIKARKDVGTLIVGQSIPKALGAYFEEVKNCYVFGQHVAAEGLCRVLLEIALRDVHRRRGTHKAQRGKDLEEWGIRKLLREASFLSREIREIGEQIIDESSDILHGKQKGERPVPLFQESLLLMRKTFLIVEKLYSS